jgi:hypothetical protein
MGVAPYPLYTDGTDLYTSFDGGATLLPLGGEAATSHSAAPVSGNGTVGTPFTIASGAIGLPELATQALNTFVANGTGGTASPTAITAAAASALLPAATSSVAGLMSAAQAASFASVQGNGILLGVFRTPLSDLTTPALIAVDMPLISGKRFYSTATWRCEIATRDATLTTQLIYSLAQGGVDTALTGSPIITGNANAFAAPLNVSAAIGLLIPSFDMTTNPLQIRITQGFAGSGLTTCTGRIALIGYYA